jgi:hypothetical protein
VKKMLLVVALLTQGCVVSKEQYRSLAKAFDSYYWETDDMYERDIATSRLESVRNAKRNNRAAVRKAIDEALTLAGVATVKT